MIRHLYIFIAIIVFLQNCSSTKNNNANNLDFEVNIDEEVYKTMPPIVRMNAFDES